MDCGDETVKRRQFLGLAAASLVPRWLVALEQDRPESSEGKVVTVTGPVPPEQMGVTLPHEHVLVDFIGADRIHPGRYDREEAFQVILPHLKAVRELGCRTFCECTPNFLGRDPRLLVRLARATGLNILTNTGLYGAAKDKYVPEYAYRETAEQLARRWEEEFRRGIAGTGVRPGFIKIGVDAGKLSPIDRKLVVAAALVHRATGLTIAAHTGNGEAALEELGVLRSEGVSPAAFIWVHAQNERDTGILEAAARQGAWVEFDGLGPRSLDRHLELVGQMRAKGLLGRVLVSHDAGWYHVGESRGGRFRPYTTLFTDFLPRLRKAGWNEDEVSRLVVANPREAFQIRRRLL